MRRLVKLLFWILVFALLLTGMDQLLTRVPPVHPVHAAFSDFYRDFRARLSAVIVIPEKGAPQTVEAVIDKEQRGDRGASAPAAATRPPVRQGIGRYVYADAQGVLQFADSLQDVPAEYRAGAEPLEE